MGIKKYFQLIHMQVLTKRRDYYGFKGSPLEGETVPIDGKFSNGLRYPRDPDDGRPEELINCRCYLTYGGF